jgi:hypothetical protein
LIDWGHHRFLLARLVDDLVVQRDEQGKETAMWKNHPLPDSSWFRQRNLENSPPL